MSFWLSNGLCCYGTICRASCGGWGQRIEGGIGCAEGAGGILSKSQKQERRQGTAGDGGIRLLVLSGLA